MEFPSVRPFRMSLVLILAVLAAGCSSSLCHYTDPVHGVSVSYPDTADLFSDKVLLQEQVEQENPQQATAIDHPEILFVITTMARGQLTCSIYQLPADSTLSPEQYYEASTAKELAAGGVDVVEPRSEVVIDQKTFLTVGFEVKAGDRTVHSRLYQYLDPHSKKALVATIAALKTDWPTESGALASIVESLRFDWSGSSPSAAATKKSP